MTPAACALVLAFLVAGPARAGPIRQADTLAAPPAPGDRGVVLQRMDLRHLPRVAAWFTVRDDSGEWLKGLGPGDLVIALDGVVLDLSAGSTRLSSRLANGEYLTVAFAVDLSGSMRPALPEVRGAIGDFITRLGERDEVGLVTFSASVQTVVPLGGDRSALLARLDSLEMGGQTALYDAVVRGLELVSAGGSPRRAVVALTDGVDNRSTATLEGIRRRAADAGIPVYAVALGPAADTAALGHLAAGTGGRLLATADSDALRALYAELAGVLTNEYRLELELPADADGTWHRLRISLVRPLPGVPGVAERPFLATTGPGVARGFVGERRAAAARASAVIVGAAVIALGLPALLLGLAAVARRRGFRLTLAQLTIAVMAAVSAGALAALLWLSWRGSA